MRYRNGPGGLIGVTLKPKAVQKWANSLHICTHVLKEFDEMRDRDLSKEKTELSDEVDREKIRRMLKSCVNPLVHLRHPKTLFNIQSNSLESKYT